MKGADVAIMIARSIRPEKENMKRRRFAVGLGPGLSDATQKRAKYSMAKKTPKPTSNVKNSLSLPFKTRGSV